MKIADAVSALQLVPSNADQSITVTQFLKKWKAAGLRPMSDRQLQRWLPELELLNLVTGIEVRGSKRYYRASDRIASWAMTHETALRLLVSSPLLNQSLKGVPHTNGEALDVAKSVINTSQLMRRLYSKIRILPDGIGRLRPEIRPGVQEIILEAIGREKRLVIHYGGRNLRRTDEKKSYEVTPFGLVSKDGMIFLLGAETFDPPLAFALHRIKSVDISTRPSEIRDDFDLDQYIEGTYQFHYRSSQYLVDIIRTGTNLLHDALGYRVHRVGLVLNVQREALWNFEERPLSEDQKISDAQVKEDWYRLTATIPYSELLISFLLSFGGKIEIIEPDLIREHIIGEGRHFLQLYGIK